MEKIDLNKKTKKEIDEIVNNCNKLKVDESFTIPEGIITCSEEGKDYNCEKGKCIFAQKNYALCDRINCFVNERKDRKSVFFAFTSKNQINMETNNFKYFYIRANNSKSSSIIETLEDFGGRNILNLIGYTPTPHISLYYIDKDKTIRCTGIDTDKELYLSILKEGTEIKFVDSTTLPTDIYYYGNAERNKEIVAAFKKLGAKDSVNPEFECVNENCIYFIGVDNQIAGVSAKGNIGTIIRRFYKECILPPIETIEIEGNKYRKEDVLEKLQELKIY